MTLFKLRTGFGMQAMYYQWIAFPHWPVRSQDDCGFESQKNRKRLSAARPFQIWEACSTKKVSSIGPGCFEKFVALSQLTICAQVVFESVESGCKTEDLTEKLLVVCQT